MMGIQGWAIILVSTNSVPPPRAPTTVFPSVEMCKAVVPKWRTDTVKAYCVTMSVGGTYGPITDWAQSVGSINGE